MAVRIGFIGVGGIAASHLANLVRMPEAEVVALCDISAEQIEATRERVNRRLAEQNAEARLDGGAFTSIDTMLRNERLDAVYLCLPPFAHGAPEEAVIAAGLPFLVEKPVALELPVAARILAAAQKRGLLTATGYQNRYTAATQKARQLLADRIIGMALVMRFGSTPGKGWYRIQSKSGGQLIEMATHQVDLLRYLVGEVKTVYAAGGTRINHLEQPDYDILDVNCMTLTFENGAVANFANNFISGHGAPASAKGLHIFCNDLTLSLDSGLTVITQGGTEELPREGNAMALEDAAFVKAVGEGRREGILSDYHNGVRSLAVTLAGERSARTGRVIDVAQLLADEAPVALPSAKSA
ncbi:MAG TPA: Gfo/Idh/MocA family oxidoreductase [Limnochordia bacterium]|nr:Gfo/Idh/MocA family oxidoreductase [Limnochordia bacterium]